MVTRKSGNSNWGKPDTGRQPLPSQTSFEEVAKAMNLSPQEYARSVALKEWARKNKDRKYVPLDLLNVWGFEVTLE